MLTKIKQLLKNLSIAKVESNPVPFSYQDLKKSEEDAYQERLNISRKAVASSGPDVDSLVKEIVRQARMPGAIKLDTRKCDWNDSEQYVFRTTLNPNHYGNAMTHAYWKAREKLSDYFPGWDIVLLCHNNFERYRTIDSRIEIIFVKHRKSK